MVRPVRRGIGVHPVVRAYAGSDRPLIDILRSRRRADQATQALLYMQQCLARKRLARDAIEAAQAVPIEETDPEMLVFLLSSWAELSCRIARPSDAEALMHRARALISPKTHAEIRAVATLVESILAGTKGNQVQREEKLRETLKLLPATSPRLKSYEWELALFLAQQGRGIEAETILRRLEDQVGENFPREKLVAVRFTDAVETGRLDEALQLAKQIENGAASIEGLPQGQYEGYMSLLRVLVPLMLNGIDAPPPPARAQPYVWIEVVRCLLQGRTADALRFARHEAGRLRGSFLGSGFDSFSLIRAELSAGNAEAARRLLQIRHGRGNLHYLDDLFLARVEFLLQNTAAAARHFANALTSIDHFHAHGRLDVEMQLACELSGGDVVRLTREADRLPAGARDKRARLTTSSPPPPPDRPSGVNSIVGQDSAMVQVRESILRVAGADVPVLITGATGTGKELVARALHEESQRRDLPFIAVNCGSIAESLLDSELFGHRQGAFTGADRSSKGLFEEAADGTILLDEMGTIHPRLQAALLRVLETGEIRAVGSSTTRKIKCRILAATNADLLRLVEEGEFRADLLFRLQRLGVHLPPLSDRRDDIMPLARHFLDIGRPPGLHAVLSPDLIHVLEKYDWPGNVRELRNVIERMRLMHSDKLSYGQRDLDLKFQASVSSKDIERIPLPVEALKARSLEGPVGRIATARRSSLFPGAERTERMLREPESRGVDEMLRTGRSQIRRLDRLRELFTQHGKLTRGEIIRILAVSPNTATKDLKALCDENYIERVQPSASTRSHYFRLKAPGR